MSAELPSIQEFSSWDGTPFFKGHPEEARQVYIVMTSEKGDFLAYGVVNPSQRFVFRVRGAGESQLERFEAELKAEKATVTRGPPPFEVQTGGDKPPSKGSAGTKGKPPPPPQ